MHKTSPSVGKLDDLRVQNFNLRGLGLCSRGPLISDGDLFVSQLVKGGLCLINP